ncbi:MAG: type II toxin-antitoxin system RelE/ParE family toxin [Verrucomicrobia bacterium]|nr:type II toxin-antitoxin system RelE/ParE family toxin [Verrucomicrobiota bacterium]
MPRYEINFTEPALDDLEWLRKVDQKAVLEGVDRLLSHQPDLEAKNRKRLYEHPLASWEIRVGRFRVFYNLPEGVRIVEVVAVGWKDREQLYVRGKLVKV